MISKREWRKKEGIRFVDMHKRKSYKSGIIIFHATSWEIITLIFSFDVDFILIIIISTYLRTYVCMYL